MQKKIDYNIISDLQYHKYIALLTCMDAEWSRSRPKRIPEIQDNFLKSQKNLFDICIDYKRGINKNYSNFREANSEYEKYGDDKVDSYLYNPLNYITFGTSDNLSILLLDDIDPIHHITSEIPTTIEDVNLSFCPKIENIKSGICEYKKNIPNHLDVFTDIHKLIDRENKQKRSSLNFIKKGYKFQNKTPLLAFTKYKMSAMTLLGNSLLAQQVLYNAMILKIIDSLESLENNKDKINDFSIKEDDLSELKIVFLDLQGTEEIGTLIFCNNFSVAITLITALRSLTLKDLNDADFNHEFKNKFNKNVSYNLNYKIARSPIKDSNNNYEILNSNHILRWTHSSLAITPKAFFSPKIVKSTCNGFVSAQIAFQISTGHRIEVEKIIKNINYSSNTKFINNDFHDFCIGVNDIIINSSNPKMEKPIKKYNHLYKVLELLNNYIENFGIIKNDDDPGRHIINLQTDLTIPTPRLEELIAKQLPPNHYSLISESLSIIKERLCNYDDKEDKNDQFGPHCGRLNLKTLKENTRLYGMPKSLRYSIEYMYQNYAAIISDPYLFDVAIDLYDTFATLHSLLTNHLYNTLVDKKKIIYFDTNRIKQIAILVQAINNALVHRVNKAFNEANKHEMLIDFRGGLNQILYAAEVPIKCGLGLLRRYIVKNLKKTDPKVNISENQRNIVGGLIRIGFSPGASVTSLNFGVEDQVKLAFFNLDVPHVLYVPSYIDNLHESFHFIFNTLEFENNFKKEYSKENKGMKERISEIFAILMTQFFIFKTDVDKSLYYHISYYSKSITSSGLNDSEIIYKFSEMFLRLFLVIDTITTESESNACDLDWEDIYNRSFSETLIRFENKLKRFGRFFSEYDRLINETKHSEDIFNYCKSHFKIIYPKIAYYMPFIYKNACRVYNHFDSRLNGLNQNTKWIRSKINEAFKECSPIKQELDDKSPTFIDPLILLCNLLSELYPDPNHKNLFKKKIHLKRKIINKEMNIVYSPGHWHTFQFDKYSAISYCPVPTERRERLKKQIVILKSLWDISSYMKERRMNEIISDTWNSNSN